MNHLPTGLLLAIAFVTALLPVASQPASAAPDSPIVQFGMDANSIAAQKAAGVSPDYATFWIGPWTLKSGWAGPDAQLTKMRDAGVTPAIHFYYWGDDISPSCVENGCWSDLHDAQKTREGWETLGTQLTQHLDAKMGGAPVVVFLESEFNKGGIERYEPFDGYMAAMADKIHAAYPNAIVVLGFGNWGSVYWGNFDRAAAASDMVGIQGMRGSTKQNVDGMMTLYDGLLTGVKTLKAKFPGVPVMLTDIAVSSYPEPDYLDVQHDVLAEVLDNLATLKANGVEAIIYRSWRDSRMDPANYYGQAESHWGLAWQSNGTLKPSGHAWVEAVKAERAGTTPDPTPTTTSPPPPPPQPIAVGAGVVTQAEAFATKSSGGKQGDSTAVGGTAWNQWSNGAIAQAYHLNGSTDLTLRVRGSPANGVAPHMDVYVAGVKVLSADPGRTYEEHRVTVSGQGPVEVRVAYTNDARTSSEDRNLLIDTVALAPANRAPTAAIAATVDGLTVRADGSASADPEGAALTHAWSFGDGATAIGAQATHAYAAAGTYMVTLTVSDGRASATAAQDVTVVQPNRAPTAAFTANASGLSVSVDASASSDADGDTLAYTWAWGDGSSSAGGRTAAHAYAAPGEYTVTLTAGDGQATANATRTVTAVQPNRAPTAAFTATATRLSVSVDGTGSSDADGDALAYAWSWGDGTSSAGATATHAYAAAGTYTVTLTVSDGELTATATRSVTATAPPTTTSTTTTTSSGPKATVTPSKNSNEWWIQASVTPAPSKVEAKVGDGAWNTLEKKPYGYARSIHAPTGTPVTFRVTDTAGNVLLTPSTPWLVKMEPMTATASPTTSSTTTTTASKTSTTTTMSAFQATFTPKAVGNDWWVEAKVAANQPLAKVEAKVGSGAWVQLEPRDWGTYGDSMRAPDGSKVTFRATSTSGATATSPAYTWT